jgi:hypothetical protein
MAASEMAADVAAINKDRCWQENEIGDERRKQRHAADEAKQS